MCRIPRTADVEPAQGKGPTHYRMPYLRRTQLAPARATNVVPSWSTDTVGKF